MRINKEIIKQLKDEHKQIRYVFESLYLSLKSNNSENQNLVSYLNELEDVLIPHLKLEDYIYSKLEKSKSKQTKKLARTLSDNMIKITKKVMDFFKKYEKIKISKLKKDKIFKNKLKKLIEIINKRIKLEEEKLFPVFLEFDG